MEFYLLVDGGIITDIKYYSDGCSYTKECAAMTADLAVGKSVEAVLNISAGVVSGRFKELPLEHLHCSILSVSTLYRAIADYLLKP